MNKSRLFLTLLGLLFFCLVAPGLAQSIQATQDYKTGRVLASAAVGGSPGRPRTRPQEMRTILMPFIWRFVSSISSSMTRPSPAFGRWRRVSPISCLPGDICPDWPSCRNNTIRLGNC